MEKQDIINLFLVFMQWSEQPFRNWYVGVTQNLKQRLAQHSISIGEGHYFHETASSSQDAREIEKTLIEKYGLSGSPGGGDEDARIVYIFRMTPSTNPKLNESKP